MPLIEITPGVILNSESVELVQKRANGVEVITSNGRVELLPSGETATVDTLFGKVSSVLGVKAPVADTAPAPVAKPAVVSPSAPVAAPVAVAPKPA